MESTCRLVVSLCRQNKRKQKLNLKLTGNIFAFFRIEDTLKNKKKLHFLASFSVFVL